MSLVVFSIDGTSSRKPRLLQAASTSVRLFLLLHQRWKAPMNLRLLALALTALALAGCATSVQPSPAAKPTSTSTVGAWDVDLNLINQVGAAFQTRGEILLLVLHDHAQGDFHLLSLCVVRCVRLGAAGAGQGPLSVRAPRRAPQLPANTGPGPWYVMPLKCSGRK